MPFLVGPFNANPSSGYPCGVAVKKALETARAQVAAAVGAHSSEITFTSGGTEAINMVLLGAVRSMLKTHDSASCGPLHVITSTVEHVAVLRALEFLQSEHGIEVTRVTVDPSGRVHPSDVVAAVKPSTRLVSIMLANNEVRCVVPYPCVVYGFALFALVAQLGSPVCGCVVAPGCRWGLSNPSKRLSRL